MIVVEREEAPQDNVSSEESGVNKRSEACHVREVAKVRKKKMQLMDENARLRKTVRRLRKRMQRAQPNSLNPASGSSTPLREAQHLQRTSPGETVTALRYHFAMMKMLRNNSQRRRTAGDTLKQVTLLFTHSQHSQHKLISHMHVQMCNQYRCKGYLVNQCHTSHRWLKRGLRKKRQLKIDPVHVVDFLCRDDNTRLTAGKKDTRTSGKEKQQIRYLHFSIDVLYDKYVAEHPHIEISRTSFYRLKPFFILQPNMFCVEQCLCIQCTNMQVFISKCTLQLYQIVQQKITSFDFMKC
jgi:hypothetical protein